MLFDKFRSPVQKTSTPEIILVSGLPRSGTSLMMEMLQAGGIPIVTDNFRAADDDNPLGYYEFERVKRIPTGDTAWLSQESGKAVKIIAPILTYLPDIYLYKVVFMKRDMEEVLASQREMLKRRNQDHQLDKEEKIRDVFHQNQRSVIKFMKEHDNFSFTLCDYNELLRDPIPCIQKIMRFLDLRVDQEQLVKIINPNLYRQRLKNISVKEIDS